MTYPPQQPPGQGMPPQYPPQQGGPQPYPSPQGAGQPYPPQQGAGQPYPPQQGPGQQFAPQQGQPYPPQGYPQQPQQYSGQPYQQDPYSAQTQQFSQQPEWAPPPAGGPRPPAWKLPLVIVGGIVVVVLVVVGVVLAVNDGSDSGSTAAATSTTTKAAATTTGAGSTTKSTSAKPTTTTKAAGTVPAGVQSIVDALPAALRQSVLKNDVRQKPGDDYRGEAALAGLTISAHDALTQGLMHWPDNEYYPLVSITTKPEVVLHIWQSQHPDWTSDEGSRVVRIDPGDANSGGAATLELFVPQSKLCLTMSGFKNVDAAKQFVQRAGF